MGRYRSKVCIRCDVEYEPTSGSQKHCHGCRDYVTGSKYEPRAQAVRSWKKEDSLQQQSQAQTEGESY